MRLAPTLVALAVLLLPGPRTKAAEARFLDHFTPAHEQILAINDPLPHLEKLLASPALRKVLVEGALGQAIRRTQPNEQTDPARGWEFVRANQRWMPAEIAIGLEESGVRAFDAMFRLMILGSVGQAAQGMEGDAGKDALARVEAEAPAHVGELRVPAMRIYARMRQAEDAAALVGMLGLQLKQANAPPTVKLTIEEKRISAAARLGDAFPEDTLRGFVSAGGLAAAPDSPAAGQMAKALAALRVEATLEAVGDGMVLTIGPAPRGNPLKAADLGPLFRWDAGDAVWAQWNAARLRIAAKAWKELWGRWEDTPVGKAALEDDDEGFLSSVKAIARQIEDLGARGAMRLWTDPASSALRAEMREQGVKEAEALGGSAVAKAVPASAEAYEVRTNATLADLVAGTLLEAEDRADRNVLKAQVGNRPGAEQITEAVEAYYRHFAPARTLILEKASEHFAPGAAWLIGTRGTVSRFELSVEEGAEKMAFRGKDLPMMEFALVGRVKDAAKADAFMRELYAAIVQGVRAAAGVEGAKDKAEVRQADVGLGRPTSVFDAGWLDQLAQAGGTKLSGTVEGDLRPHYFLVGDLLVFSTSPRLSREIAGAAAGGGNASVALPAGDGRLVQRGLMPGQTLGKYARHATAWVNMVAGGLPEPQRGEAANVGPFLTGIAELIELIGEAEWRVDQAGDQQTTRATVTFR